MFLAKQMTVALQRLFLKLPREGVAFSPGIVFVRSDGHRRIESLCYRFPDLFGQNSITAPGLGCGSITAHTEVTIQSSIRLIAPAAWEMHYPSSAAEKRNRGEFSNLHEQSPSGFQEQ
jgi:hypothetical protein